VIALQYFYSGGGQVLGRRSSWLHGEDLVAPGGHVMFLIEIE
jgi:hypothetical protein